MSLVKCCFRTTEVSDVFESMVQKCTDSRCKLHMHVKHYKITHANWLLPNELACLFCVFNCDYVDVPTACTVFCRYTYRGHI